MVACDGEFLTLTLSSDFSIFNTELRQAVEATFPGFGYAPEEIARFLSLNAEPFDDTHYLLREGDRTVAVAMRCGDLLEYVVPGRWEDRYHAVAHAISALKADHPTLRVHIKEDLPSHSAWYAALLAVVGFGMTPRVRMLAPVVGLQAAPSREEIVPYRTASMEPRLLDACVALYLEGYELSGLQADGMVSNLRESVERPDRLGCWMLAFRGDELVGSCFGSHHRGHLFIEELVVAKEHRNQGLGRALLLECVRKLIQAFPECDSVVLDVDRINVPAVHLYTTLGFSAQANYTVAKL